MRRIYHMVAPADWPPPGSEPYRAASLATEGFIHFSNADQVARVANLFYAAVPALLLLNVDADRLTSPLRDEDPGVGERFPHLHGPLNLDAVVAVETLSRGADGQWVYPAAPAGA